MSANEDSETGEPEPVDAEFEPADDGPEDGAGDRPSGGGPGWPAFIGAVMLAALVGGGSAWIAERYLAPAPEAGVPDAVESRLAALENRPDAATPAELAAIADRVEALESRTAEQADEIAAVTTGLRSLRELIGQGDDVEGGSSVDVAAIEDLIARAETAAESASASAEAAQDAARAAQSASASAAETAEAGAPADEGPDPALVARLSQTADRLDALDAALVETREALEARIAEASQSNDDRFAALAGRIDTLEQSVGATRETARNALETAQSAEAAVQATTGAATAELRAVASRALGLTALRDAAAGSGPFEAERAALARVWSDQPDLDALETLARSGAPTRAALAETFPGDAVRDAAGEARTFLGVISLRPAEDEGGDGPAAIASRIEARLARDDLAGAVEAAERLEDAPAEAARNWLAGARARLEIEARLAALRRDLAETSATEEFDPR
ncbi:hypothetical protein DDZ18_00890 [Marinicauda salina]|uniref:Mitochondrial inner membrane protein n=1 Tax=Marinicauda salina TaxID=2135793 RepID=A0A2U2BW11_9PROT|nr:hypothetical protein [Marinicauda salina]PWE18198.1 hypothetical protein DDZ18_00890 [Marinicauda salina]